MAREGASGGSLRCSAEPSESKAPYKRVTVGELVDGSEAQYPSDGARSGDGVGVKFCVLTRRDLTASAQGAVVVEDQRTR